MYCLEISIARAGEKIGDNRRRAPVVFDIQEKMLQNEFII